MTKINILKVKRSKDNILKSSITTLSTLKIVEIKIKRIYKLRDQNRFKKKYMTLTILHVQIYLWFKRVKLIVVKLNIDTPCQNKNLIFFQFLKVKTLFDNNIIYNFFVNEKYIIFRFLK